MHISIIKKDYIVKSVLFISFLFVISLGLIGGCSDGGGGKDSQTLTENDFAENSALRAELDEGVVVTFLESPNSDAPENDTGTLGKDDIPVTYDETTEQTFCWEDDDVDAMHFMVLLDSEGMEILRIDVNGDCITKVIEAGEYVMTIHHDGRNLTTYPIFMIPNPDDIQQARKTDGLINRFKVVIVNILQGIQNTVSKDARAQTVQDNINTLIKTKKCQLCVLSGADLSHADLSDANLDGAFLVDAILFQADLSGANLFQAILRDADLRGAVLSGADLRGANLLEADLRGADLRGADLFGAGLSRADLRGADLSGAILFLAGLFRADLNGADLRGASLSFAHLERAVLIEADLRGSDLSDAILFGADLSGADLSDADLSGAEWCDGCHCADPSISTCVGCLPQTTCR